MNRVPFLDKELQAKSVFAWYIVFGLYSNKVDGFHIIIIIMTEVATYNPEEVQMMDDGQVEVRFVD